MLSNTCQQFNVVGSHPLSHLALSGMRRNFGLRSTLRRALSDSAALGDESRHQEGDWVRVLDAPDLKLTLNAASRTRGLLFLPYQWPYCGGVFRVQKVMRRMVDDKGFGRSISRTILLEGVDCGGIDGTSGCGRRCPLMFRDEWVEAAPAPAFVPSPGTGAFKRVRPADEIRATLDWQGKRDGLKLMPEMLQWAGQRLRVAKVVQQVYEVGRHARTTRPFYILEGLHCSGDVLNGKGPCHRACSIMWHEDWLADDV